MRSSQVAFFASPQEAIRALAAALAELQLGQQALVVVPSTSLRHGLVQRLCEEREAWAGVRVITLQGLALELLARAHQMLRVSDSLLPVLVSRAANSGAFPHLALVKELGKVGPLVGTVRDLLDAGFTEMHLEPCLEALEGKRLPDALRERAEEVLQVTVAVAGYFKELHLARSADALVQATALLTSAEENLWPVEAVFVYGFADATGVAGDFLEALKRRFTVNFYMVSPPDPLEQDTVAGEDFLQRLLFHLSLPWDRKPPKRESTSRWALWQAPDLEAEICGVAEDIALFLAEGGKPEDVAVVARDLSPYLGWITRTFTDLGVPFSAEGESLGQHPQSGVFNFLLTLFEKGEEAPTEALCALLASQGGKPHLDSEVREWAAHVGAATMGKLLRQEGFPGTQQAGHFVAPICRFLAKLPEQAPGAVWGQKLRELTELILANDKAQEQLAQASAELLQEVADVWLHRGEWCFLVKEKLKELLACPPGGQGAGVAVLTVMEARLRSFKRIYLLGLLREVFPRVAQEDPLLPEVVRQQLECVLPDIPRAVRSPEEERYLFGLLLVSAPEVRLCWPSWDEKGREQARSPYVDELLAGKPELTVMKLPPALSVENPRRLAPASRWAKVAGLQGNRGAWRELLALALHPYKELVPKDLQPIQVAQARSTVLEEWDPPPERKMGSVSPYLGFLGQISAERLKAATVTFWERYATCPWQVWLTRVLKVQPLVLGFAEVTAAQVGSLVHRVLRRVIQDAAPNGSTPWQSLLKQGNYRVVWPEEVRFNELCWEEATEVFKEEGIPPWPGMLMYLVQAAKPFLKQARELLFPAGEGRFLAAEEWAAATLGERRVNFRFDAALLEEGKVVFLDYKTGRPGRFREGRQGVLAKVRQGVLLQGACYAVSGQGEGRYVFLDPSWEGEPLERVPYSPELEATLTETLELFGAAAEAGVFFPRLWDPVEEREPETCNACPVRLACSRGESGVRRRLISWAGRYQPENRADLGGRIFWLVRQGKEKA